MEEKQTETEQKLIKELEKAGKLPWKPEMLIIERGETLLEALLRTFKGKIEAKHEVQKEASGD